MGKRLTVSRAQITESERELLKAGWIRKNTVLVPCGAGHRSTSAFNVKDLIHELVRTPRVSFRAVFKNWHGGPRVELIINAE